MQVDDLRVEVLDGFDFCVDLLGRDVLGALGEVGLNLDIAQRSVRAHEECAAGLVSIAECVVMVAGLVDFTHAQRRPALPAVAIAAPVVRRETGTEGRLKHGLVRFDRAGFAAGMEGDLVGQGWARDGLAVG